MIYGWDISTSIVGVVCFNHDGKFVWAKHIDLRKIDGLNPKARAVEQFFEELPHLPNEINRHFIEERLGGFAAGRTSAQVMMKLAAFNAIVSFILYKHGNGDTVHIHPSTWKAVMKREGLIIPKGADKKEITLEFAIRKEPQFVSFLEKNRNDKWQVWCYDMADAYCIGRSGYRKLCSEKES